MTPQDFLDEIRFRLKNPAVSDPELLRYITLAMRDVAQGLYNETDYMAQVSDTACIYLCRDNKFPEVSSVSGGGVTTSFAANDPRRYQQAVAGRRQAIFI